MARYIEGPDAEPMENPPSFKWEHHLKNPPDAMGAENGSCVWESFWSLDPLLGKFPSKWLRASFWGSCVWPLRASDQPLHETWGLKAQVRRLKHPRISAPVGFLGTDPSPQWILRTPCEAFLIVRPTLWNFPPWFTNCSHFGDFPARPEGLLFQASSDEFWAF